MRKYFERSNKMIRLFFSGFEKHDLMTHAAALAFYTVLSLAPMLLFMLFATRFLRSDFETHLFLQVQQIMGTEASESIRIIMRSVHGNQELKNFTGIFGLVTLLFSASGVFSQFQSSLNSIWEFQPTLHFSGWFSYLRNKIFSMGTVIVFGFLELLSLSINAIIAVVFPTGGGIWKALNELVTLTIFTCLFAFIFKYFSYRKILLKYVFLGGFTTSFLFTVGKVLIGIYLGKNTLASAYGAAGSFIILLVWVYYSSLIMFIGAEFTGVLFKNFEK